MAKQRISYVPLDKMDDAMRAEMERCAREGTPRPESQAVRAHVPAAFWSFANSWRDVFKNGVSTTRSRSCAGSTCRAPSSASTAATSARSRQPARACARDSTMTCSTSRSRSSLNDRQKAALAYAEAITWRLDADDALWERLHKHFSEPELVEIGYFIALTMGQQRWLRTLNIEHHQ